MKRSKTSSTRNTARLVSLPFAYECGRRGAVISPPLVGDAVYDFIVDSRTTQSAMFRVRVVTATREKNSSYYAINAQKMVGRKKVPFARHEVDCIVTQIGGDWYFFSQPHSMSSNKRIDPTQSNREKNNWAELQLPVDVH